MNYILRFRRLQLSVRCDNILSPSDIAKLLKALPPKGYSLSREYPSLPAGGRLSLSGELARKGDVSLRLNDERDVVAVESSGISSLLKEFSVIEQLLRDKVDMDIEERSFYYEMLAALTVESNKNPMVVLENRLGSPLLDRLSDILGQQASNFTMRLVPSGGEPDSVDWFDIRIEPFLPDYSTRFFISAVFRNRKKSRVTSFLEGLSGTVKQLISQLED